MNEDVVRAKLALAPHASGVYLFKSEGRVIYVGKAADLRNRVGSYFGGKAGLNAKVLRMVDAVEDIEYILTGNEQQALVLEADLVRRYKPHFNARLKDDKSFPYLEVNVGNEWPTVAVTRRRVNNDSLYFGPYASVHSMRQTLRLIRKTFPLRACRGELPTGRKRPCLNAHIGLCPAPCVGAADHGKYLEAVRLVILFLQGRHTDVLKSLVTDMEQAAARLDFELAAQLRDQIRAVELVTGRYEGVNALRGDQDILAVAHDRETALVDVFSVRSGRALGRQTFPVANSAGSLPGDVLRSFIVEFYQRATSIPSVVLLQHPIDDASLIASWLSELRGDSVRVLVPRRGARKQIVDNVADGVARQLAGMKAIGGQGVPPRDAGLLELKNVLSLPSLPHRIEGYDISNIQGREAVGSMVAFIDGVSTPSEYRRFRIRGIEGQNDYAMLKQVLLRRLNRLRPAATGESEVAAEGWAQQPSLILVDGGRGQLAAALSAREATPGCDVPMVSLAEEHEEVFVEGQQLPAPFEWDSPGLLILQAVRDEAHRFALSYHRRLHRTSALTSALDDIDGIGPRRRRALMLAYGSLEALRSAEAADIAVNCRIPLAAAQRLKEKLVSPAMTEGQQRSREAEQTEWHPQRPQDSRRPG